MLRHSLSWVLTSAILSLLMSFVVFATPPTRPTEFTVKLDGNGQPPATAILKWKAPSDDTTLEYVVYMASIINNTPTDFRAILETFNTEALVKELQAGIYKFYVIARNKDGASDASEKVMITVAGVNNTTFKFISEPIRTGIAGAPYAYQVKLSFPADYKGGISYALDKSPDGMSITPNGLIEWKSPVKGVFVITVSATMNDAPKLKISQTYELTINAGGTTSKFAIVTAPIVKGCVGKEYVYEPKVTVPVDGGKVFWSLISSPDGMSINENTGRIFWIPTKAGAYKIILLATFIKGNDTLKTDQSWVINVTNDCIGDKLPPCAKFVGVVKDETGNPIPFGRVRAIRLEKDNLGPSAYDGEIKNGLWTLMVRKGTYKIQFLGDLFMPEWYQDVNEMPLAKELFIDCEKIIEVSAKVSLREKPIFHIVEGKVANAAGEGIANAMVNFMSVDKNNDFKQGNTIRSIKTDEKGNYRVELPQGITMIANAVPTGDAVQKYLQIFYDNKANVNDASRFVLTAPMAINFTLPERPVYNNGITASLNDTNNAGLIGRIVLIPVTNGIEPKKGMARTLETDSLGYAYFKNIIPGVYILQGMPLTRQFAPGFYVNNGFAVQSWKEATRIEVGENMITIVYNIRLKPILGKRGSAKLDGIINGRGAMKSDNPLQTTELAGAFITAYDDNNDIVDYSISDDRGAFTLSELGQGNYTIFADKVDYSSSTSMIATDYTNAPYLITSITLGSAVTSADDISTIAAGSIYPQPAHSNVSITLPMISGSADIELFSLMGNKLGAFTAVIDNGIATIDVSALPTGQYTFKAHINQSNTVKTGQLMIAH